jgi:ATP-dependent Clp protease ATP-binding subunit ClpC
VFERFTDRARRVVVLAQEEARLLNHAYIGTEHILLGLMAEEESIAARALTQLGVDLDQVRDAVEEIIGTGTEPAPGQIPFTPRAKKVLELSLRESIGLSHNYIGTEHILLGIVREGEGVANQVLERYGVGTREIRATVISLLGFDPTMQSAPPSSRRVRGGSCTHPAEALEVRPAEGFRTVRCMRCGQLVGVLPAA